MEHEVFVPVPAVRLGEVLADPVRVARAVPGLQQDAGAEPVAGRLKVRVGGHSITYRGSLRLSARGRGGYAVEGEAVEVRGNGKVTVSLTLRVRDAEGGSLLAFDGTAVADGRVAELPEEAVRSSVTRLLTRFGANLGVAAGADGADGPGTPAADESAAAPETEYDAPAAEYESPETDPEGPAPDDAAGLIPEVPETPEGIEAAEAQGIPAPPEPSPSPAPAPETPPPPPVEAAHARRTMIGRSAEEVDHAPPRGRYAPVPVPEASGAGSPLRWAAPAAALAVASAIVVGRALRRRR
ncbi:SRPBCC domain-containing protein [Streptomyces sp. NPDC048182]|uniref:SRPBCC domain-containing protein n=1 Tax=Streptomyces sp. NPDC048182 TaxID=3365507 RepID=UPI003717D6DD